MLSNWTMPSLGPIQPATHRNPCGQVDLFSSIEHGYGLSISSPSGVCRFFRATGHSAKVHTGAVPSYIVGTMQKGD
uniref:Uncharacterized protein n=1 Tax=Romanomermis culicivorax TaxID=13658 RepID=A0A915KDJ5_ROMCU